MRTIFAIMMSGVILGAAASAAAQTAQDSKRPDPEMAICEHPALADADKTDCRDQMQSARSDAEKTEVRAVFEAKVRAAGMTPEQKQPFLPPC